MTTISVFIGKRIKEIREAQNIKQVQLADMINMEPANLSKIENGIHIPKDETINKILNALGCDIKTLLSFKYQDEADSDTRAELLENIYCILNNSQTEDIKFFYRVIKAYNQTFCSKK